VVLGFELRALCLQGKNSTFWVTPLALFVLVILEIGSHFLPTLSWTTNFLFYTSHFMLPTVAGMTGVCHCAQLLVEMGSCELLFWAGLKPQFSWFQPPKNLGLQAWSTYTWQYLWIFLNRVSWSMPIIPSTQEVEVRGSKSEVAWGKVSEKQSKSKCSRR
jgi:hypothetical protein